MTLEGAKRALRGDRSQKPEVNANVELLERLQSLRSMLVAIRDSLDEQTEVAAVEPVASAEVAQPAVEAPKPAYREQTLFDW